MDQQLFTQLEAACRPMLRAIARQFASQGELEFDDCLQDARIALYQGFQSYDYNASGGTFKAYARTIVNNSLRTSLQRVRARSRTPTVNYVLEGGEVERRRLRVTSLDHLLDTDDHPLCAPGPTPEDQYIEAEFGKQVAALKAELATRLGATELAVFEALTSPANEDDCETKSVIRAVGRQLGQSKNVIDWRVHKIKGQITELLERDFSAEIAPLVEAGEWPSVEMVDALPEFEGGNRFRRETDGACLERVDYAWGATLRLRLGDVESNLVVHGRFNELDGKVYGAFGMFKSVVAVVPWYKKLLTELKRMTTGRMPRCVGEYEKGCEECDGKGDAKPCFWRDRCVAFGLLLKKQNARKDRYVRLKVFNDDGEDMEYAVAKIDHEKFKTVLDRFVIKHDISAGKVGSMVGSDRKEKPKRPTSETTPGRERALEIVSWFHAKLEKAYGSKIQDAQGKAAKLEMFYVDRLEQSNYISVYVKDADGKRVAISSTHPNSKSGLIQIRVALSADALRSVLAKDHRLSIEPIKDGKFTAKVSDCSKKAASVIVEAIVLAVEQGMIVAPEFRG